MAGTLNAGALSIAIMADTQKLSQGFNDAQRKTASFAQSLDRDIGARLKSIFNPLTLGIAGATVAVGGLVAAIKQAAAAETLQVQFATLLDSGEKAKRLMADIRKFAAATPFETPELADATRQLLAYGIESKDVMGTLRQLGDISALTGSSIGELAYLYGTSATQGRLFAKDLYQFQGRGIPVVQELAKQFGVATGEIMKMTEEGKISFDDLKNAIAGMTSETGKFGGGMKELSETAAGKWSTFTDGIKESLRLVGEEVLPALVKLLPVMTELVEQGGRMAATAAKWAMHVAHGAAVMAKPLTAKGRANFFDVPQLVGLADAADMGGGSFLSDVTFGSTGFEKQFDFAGRAPHIRRLGDVTGQEEFTRAAVAKDIAKAGVSELGAALGMALTTPAILSTAIGGAIAALPSLPKDVGKAAAFMGAFMGAPGMGGPGRAEFRGNDAVLAGSVEAARLAAIQRMRLPHETEAVKIQRQQLATLKSIDKKAGAVPANVLVAF